MMTKAERTTKYFDFINCVTKLSESLAPLIERSMNASDDHEHERLFEEISKVVPKWDLEDLTDAHFRDAILVWTAKNAVDAQDANMVKATVSLFLRPMDGTTDVHAEGALNAMTCAAICASMVGQMDYALSLMGRARARAIETDTDMPKLASLMVDVILLATVDMAAACASLIGSIKSANHDDLWQNFDLEVNEDDMWKALGL